MENAEDRTTPNTAGYGSSLSALRHEGAVNPIALRSAAGLTVSDIGLRIDVGEPSVDHAELRTIRRTLDEVVLLVVDVNSGD
jgi:hypothetical protein